MTRVLIVDDHPVFRDGLAGLLATETDLEVIEAVSSAEDALAVLDRAQPDVILMDIGLPGISGVAATRQLLARAPSARVLIISMFDQDETVYASLAAGASGYMLKDSSPEDMVAAIRTVRGGGAVFGPGLATQVLGALRTSAPAGAVLTQREREILDLITKGRTNSQIATVLGVSLKTVQNHVSRILTNLHAKDRRDAAAKLSGSNFHE